MIRESNIIYFNGIRFGISSIDLYDLINLHRFESKIIRNLKKFLKFSNIKNENKILQNLLQIQIPGLPSSSSVKLDIRDNGRHTMK